MYKSGDLLDTTEGTKKNKAFRYSSVFDLSENKEMSCNE